MLLVRICSYGTHSSCSRADSAMDARTDKRTQLESAQKLTFEQTHVCSFVSRVAAATLFFVAAACRPIKMHCRRRRRCCCEMVALTSGSDATSKSCSNGVRCAGSTLALSPANMQYFLRRGFSTDEPTTRKAGTGRQGEHTMQATR